MELLTEMSRLDDATTVGAMLKLRDAETDAPVREQATLLLAFMRSTPPDVLKKLSDDVRQPRSD